jgi:glycolate oxidase FAD binding subunit
MDGSMEAMPGFAKTTSAQALDSLREIVVEGVVRRGVSTDEVCGVVPELYAEPANEAEMARVLEYANRAEMLVAPRGGGTKMDWGPAAQAIDLMISSAKFSRVLEYAPGDMTVTVGAGVTITQLQSVLAEHRQRLALDPLWPERATVGGVIATNDSGALRVRYGGVRDLIIGITVVLGAGTIAASGGKVVKNVAGYDLPKLMSGALGTLGIITRAVFRLHPLPQESKTLSFSFLNREKANEFMLSITDSVVVPTGLQMRTGANGNVAVDVRLDGIAAGVAAQAETVCKLAGSVNPSDAGVDVWRAREQLWNSGASASICKLSMLPAQLSSTAEFIREALSDNADWTLVMYSTGLAWLQLDATDCAEIAAFVSSIRTFLAPTGGTAVVLKAPSMLRQKVDLWGSAGSALPLMKRVKEQFDPRVILNRGRFVGGI